MTRPKNTYFEQLPVPPADLPEDARRAWQEIGTAAIKVGRLSDADLVALELAARSLASVRSLEAAVLVDGPVIASGAALKANPCLAALDRARGHARGLLEAFGLSPAARG